MKNKTYKMWIEDVAKRHCDLYSVPKRYITSKMCLAAVRAKRSLKQIKIALMMKDCNFNELITHYICLEAVRRSRLNMDHVPKKFLTFEMYLTAVQKGFELYFVPKKFLTCKMYLTALQSSSLSLMKVPNEFKTAELCLVAVLTNYENLQYVPLEYRTNELYLAAVQKNGNALSYVPIEFRTPYLCSVAVKENGDALYYVPPGLRTHDICFTAVMTNRENLRNTGCSYQSVELFCLTSTIRNYSLIPENIKTPEFLLAVAFKGYDILNHFSEKMPTGTFSVLSQFLM